MSKKALAALQRIYDYICKDNEEAATKTVVTILHKINMQLPLYPKSAKPGRLDGTRELFFSDVPYRVLYSLTTDTIKIISVFHTSQNRI
jgi:plasmid stabilization system protein ParE